MINTVNTLSGIKRVALVTGSTRGIGANIILKLAQNSYNVVITGKTDKDVNNKGSIYSTQKMVEKYDIESLPIKLDLMDINSISNCVEEIDKKFGRLDVLINNASALWWTNIQKTPEKRYDLINNINSKGSFFMSKECLKLMEKNKYGHIINHSPPLLNTNIPEIYKDKTGYMISKFGMSMVAMGIAAEYKGTGIAANTIWPKTAIESDAVRNTGLGNIENWRKPDIISDSIIKMLLENTNYFTGQQWIDEDYLRSKGITDFKKYRCVPDVEPIPLMDLFNKNNFK
jgi:citronellol/citronellal dehydrogenase